ncbi:DUF4296 domain-containing protein [Bacteroidia bacterium]|nr:DUF4296 domain-containing protein [Bacteroidia bacterium]
MKTKILLLSFIAIVSSCSDTIEQMPDGILDEAGMISVIIDIQILDAAQKSLPLSGDKQKAMQDTTYTIIYNKHGTTHAEFDSSMRVYSHYPEKMGAIMEEVAKRINKSK